MADDGGWDRDNLAYIRMGLYMGLGGWLSTCFVIYVLLAFLVNQVILHKSSGANNRALVGNRMIAVAPACGVTSKSGMSQMLYAL
jgi:hypothetical protein